MAIVGCTESHRHAPWADPSWTLVVHPSAFQLCGRAPDWWMDLHPEACHKQKKGWNPQYYRWLQALRQPIFMQEDWPDVPMAVRFPRERVLAEFTPFFTNHCAWMIALAMTEGATHLGLFGCEYKSDAERGLQRGSLLYWMGRFAGTGGHLVLPPGTSFWDPRPLYGYQSHDPVDGKLIPAYRTKIPPEAAQRPQQAAQQQFQILDPGNAEGRLPLATPPPGIEPAWHRSGHAIRA